MSNTMSSARREFLTDMLCMAVEHGGHGWFSVDEYQWDVRPPAMPYAAVTSHDEDVTHQINFTVLNKGIAVIRDAELRVYSNMLSDGQVLHNVASGARLHMSTTQRRAIMAASRDNDAGGLDVIDALAVVECGLFGQVTYA